MNSIDVADPDVRAVVLTVSGNGAFCTGADLGNSDDMSDPATCDLMKLSNPVVGSIISCPKPVIAAVNGAEAGFGVALVAGPPLAFRKTKDAINAATPSELPAAFERDTVRQIELLGTDGFRTAATAFTVKRNPVFSGT